MSTRAETHTHPKEELSALNSALKLMGVTIENVIKNPLAVLGSLVSEFNNSRAKFSNFEIEYITNVTIPYLSRLVEISGMLVSSDLQGQISNIRKSLYPKENKDGYQPILLQLGELSKLHRKTLDTITYLPGSSMMQYFPEDLFPTPVKRGALNDWLSFPGIQKHTPQSIRRTVFQSLYTEASMRSLPIVSEYHNLLRSYVKKLNQDAGERLNWYEWVQRMYQLPPIETLNLKRQDARIFFESHAKPVVARWKTEHGLEALFYSDYQTLLALEAAKDTSEISFNEAIKHVERSLHLLIDPKAVITIAEEVECDYANIIVIQLSSPNLFEPIYIIVDADQRANKPTNGVYTRISPTIHHVSLQKMKGPFTISSLKSLAHELGHAFHYAYFPGKSHHGEPNLSEMISTLFEIHTPFLLTNIDPLDTGVTVKFASQIAFAEFGARLAEIEVVTPQDIIDLWNNISQTYMPMFTQYSIFSGQFGAVTLDNPANFPHWTWGAGDVYTAHYSYGYVAYHVLQAFSKIVATGEKTTIVDSSPAAQLLSSF